jgi:hypothetical protein
MGRSDHRSKMREGGERTRRSGSGKKREREKISWEETIIQLYKRSRWVNLTNLTPGCLCQPARADQRTVFTSEPPKHSSRSDSHLPNVTFSNPPVRPPVFVSPFDLYSTSPSQNPFLRPPSPPEATGPIPKRHLSNSPPETRDHVVVDAESSAHQVTSRSLPADADGEGVEEGGRAEKDGEWERENLVKMLKMAADWGDSTFYS